MVRYNPTRSTPAADNRAGLDDRLDLVLTQIEHLRRDIAEMKSRDASRRKSHLSVDEIADQTGRSAYTVRRWISLGRLEAVRVSGTGPRGRLLVPAEQVDMLLRSGTATRP